MTLLLSHPFPSVDKRRCFIFSSILPGVRLRRLTAWVARVWVHVPVSLAERETLLDDFCAAALWQPIYFRWRPSLPDAGDDHVLELAIACGAEHRVTHNIRDFQRGDLTFSWPRFGTPAQHLKIVR